MKFPWSKPKPEPLTPEQFWAWVVENKARIEQIGPGGQGIVNEIGDKLARAHPELQFECGRAKDGPFEFVISAGGIKALFPTVHDFVSRAPHLEGWKIIAFRQRDDDAAKIGMGGREFSAGDIKFRVLGDDEDGILDIAIFIEGWSPRTEQLLASVAFIFLDKQLGEVDVATRIGEIQFFDTTHQTEEDLPLTMLRAMVDARKPDELANPS